MSSLWRLHCQILFFGFVQNLLLNALLNPAAGTVEVAVTQQKCKLSRFGIKFLFGVTFIYGLCLFVCLFVVCGSVSFWGCFYVLRRVMPAVSVAVWTQQREAYSVINMEEQLKSKFLYGYRVNCMFNTVGTKSLHSLYLSIHRFILGSKIGQHILSLAVHKILPLQSIGASLMPSTKNFTVGNSWILNSFLKSCWSVTSILPNWILGASFLSSRAASANSFDTFWDAWDKETSGKGQSKENGLHGLQCEALQQKLLCQIVAGGVG